MLQTIARVNTEILGTCLFVTLTYHNDWPKADPKRDIKVFIQRLLREDPNAALIWRIELQKRGAPHFHLLFWGSPKWGQEWWTTPAGERWIRENWEELAGDHEYDCEGCRILDKDGAEISDKYHLKYGAEIQQAESYSKVLGYLCKYVAKCDGKENPSGRDIGRRWGTSGKVPKEPLHEDELSEDQVIDLKRLARRWLWANRHKTKSKWVSKRYIKAIRLGFSNFICVDTPEWVWRWIESQMMEDTS